jgi:hypothetical protein
VSTVDLRGTDVQLNSDEFRSPFGVSIVGGSNALLTDDGDTSYVEWDGALCQGGIRWQFEALADGVSLDPTVDSYELHLVMSYGSGTQGGGGTIVRKIGGLGNSDSLPESDTPTGYTDVLLQTYGFDDDPFPTREAISTGQVYGYMEYQIESGATLRVTQAFLRVTVPGDLALWPLRQRKRTEAWWPLRQRRRPPPGLRARQRPNW